MLVARKLRKVDMCNGCGSKLGARLSRPGRFTSSKLFAAPLDSQPIATNKPQL